MPAILSYLLESSSLIGINPPTPNKQPRYESKAASIGLGLTVAFQSRWRIQGQGIAMDARSLGKLLLVIYQAAI
jgi:hypothetical protein